MASISACSVYIPVWRIKRDEISKHTGIPSMGGEKAVGNWDEDSITMAVEAAKNLDGDFDALLFASTTHPFRLKQSSSLIASALDLGNVYTMDFSNSFRASTNALITANDFVDSGKFNRVLVVSADRIPVKPGSVYEQLYGDAAIAVVVEREGGARILGYNSYPQALPGYWMLKDEVQSYDMRLDGLNYANSIQKAVMPLFAKLSLTPADFERFISSAPDPKSYETLMKTIGVKQQEFFFKNVGIAGTAHPLLLLASQLEKPGRVLLTSHGDGSDAIAIEIEKGIQTNLGKMLESKKEISYGDYLYNLGLIANRDSPDRPSITKFWREEKSIIKFYGIKCRKCGVISYPISKACIECGSQEFDEVKLGYKGRIYTFTIDYLISPGNYYGDGVHPHCVAVVDLETGGRVFFEVTDVLRDFSSIECDAAVERTFRLLFEKINFRYYGWKARLVR